VASVALIVAGLVALLGGAELVTRAGSRLAGRLGISPILVGLTVVSIGTSAPELAIGIEAARDGVGDLAVGNIAGTNAVNLLLILGLSALLRPLPLHVRTLRFDLPMMALAALALLAMAADHTLSHSDGILLLVIAGLYTAVVARVSRRENRQVRAEYGPPPNHRQAAPAASLETVALLAGIAFAIVGADWLVHGAVQVARQLGVTDAVIGLTVLAIGTSAPELATTLVGTVRRNRDVAIGNLIGSSVYNIALILGAAAVVGPAGLRLTDLLVRVDLPVMTAAVLACVPVFVRGRRMTRPEGGLFVLAYVGYLGYLLLART